MALRDHAGKIVLVVIALIGISLYGANEWSKKKTKQILVDYKKQAQKHRVNELQKMVEDDGGTYYQGIGVTPMAYIDRVSLNIPGGRSKDALLVIELYIQNVMPDRRMITCRAWPASDFAPGGNASLTDNHGKRYARAEPLNMYHKYTVKSPSIKCGGGIRDELVFESPTGEVEYLDLRLPAANVGGEGIIQIRIPGSKIHRNSSVPATASSTRGATGNVHK